MKVFIKHKILSVETILSVYTHGCTRTHTHIVTHTISLSLSLTHTHTHTHSHSLPTTDAHKHMDIQTDIQIKRPTDSPHGLQVEDGCLTRHRSEVHTACYCPPLHTDSPPVVTYTDSEENRSVTWRRESHTHTHTHLSLIHI